MMDMDIDPNPNAHFAVPTTVDADADADAYACAYCAKTVCDMCAVRGDVRVCLECANPGNGSRATNGFGHHSNNNNTGVAVSCGMEAGNAVYGGGGVPAAATAVGGRAGDGGMMLGQKRWVGGIGWM